MAVFALFAGLLLAQATAPAITVEGEGDRIDVAYQELSEGRTSEAIAKLDGTSAVLQGDPSALINLGTEPYTVHHGDRIAQAVVAPVVQASFEPVDILEETTRGAGGFGSTGRG